MIRRVKSEEGLTVPYSTKTLFPKSGSASLFFLYLDRVRLYGIKGIDDNMCRNNYYICVRKFG